MKNIKIIRYLIRRQNILMVLVSLALISGIALLLYLTYTSQIRIQNYILDQLRHDVEKRAEAVSYFYMERRNDLRSLAEQHVFSNFFENQALGMSEKYGLLDSENRITNLFDEFIKKKSLRGKNIYDALVFMNTDGTILTEIKTPEAAVGKMEGLYPPVYGQGNDAQVRFQSDDGLTRTCVDIPYYFKQSHVGKIIACISTDNAYDYLLGTDIHSTRQILAVTDEKGHVIYAVPGQADAFVKSIEGHFEQMIPGKIHRYRSAKENGSEEVVAVRMRIRDTPFNLVGLAPVKEVLSIWKPSQLLTILVLIGFFIFGSALLITKINAKRFALQIRLDESAKARSALEEKNTLLQKEIAERKEAEESLMKAEEALRESEARLLTLMNATPDIICFKDARSAWILANTGILDLYQIKDVDYQGKTEMELAAFAAPIHQDAFKNCSMSDEAAWSKGTLSRSVEIIPDANGNRRVYDVIKVPIHNPDRSRKGLVVFGRDITEFKRAEWEKDHLQAQLLQAQKMESVGRLAGGVAHDFNNKLQAILGYTSMLMSEIEKENPHHEFLQEIQQAALQSADLTRQLLAFARKQTIRLQVLDLNETISGMLKILQRLVGENIELRWTSGRDLWTVKMDPTQIDQILANLVVNSRDAISGTGQIHIMTENIRLDTDYCSKHPGAVPGDYVLLTVRDNGNGISEEISGKIFDPFFTTKEVGKGTGLGLSTVYGIVKQNKGYIELQSKPGEGATFKIFLPKTTAKVTNIPMESISGELRGGNETLLIVEDETAVMELGKRILEKLGYTVLTANTPEEAIRLTESYDGEIRLLITDVVMPQMNGRELLEQLIRIRPGLRTLLMSGYTADVIAHHGVLQEDVHFLQKPFSVVQLAEMVRGILDDGP
jgi:PAS domain S-box-containing protein